MPRSGPCTTTSRAARSRSAIEALARSGERMRATMERAGDAPDLPGRHQQLLRAPAPSASATPTTSVAAPSPRSRSRRPATSSPSAARAEDVFAELAGHAWPRCSPTRASPRPTPATRHVRAVELRGRAHHEPRAARHPADAHQRRRGGVGAARPSGRRTPRRVTPAPGNARETPVSCSKQGCGRRSANRPWWSARCSSPGSRSSPNRAGSAWSWRSAPARSISAVTTDLVVPSYVEAGRAPTGLGLLLGAVGYYALDDLAQQSSRTRRPRGTGRGGRGRSRATPRCPRAPTPPPPATSPWAWCSTASPSRSPSASRCSAGARCRSRSSARCSCRTCPTPSASPPRCSPVASSCARCCCGSSAIVAVGLRRRTRRVRGAQAVRGRRDRDHPVDRRRGDDRRLRQRDGADRGARRRPSRGTGARPRGSRWRRSSPRSRVARRVAA